MENIIILEKIKFFNGIDREGIACLLRCIEHSTRTYKAKETIIAEGDPVDRMGIILQGRVQISMTDYMGNRSIFSTIGESAGFGYTFSAAGLPQYPLEVKAVEDSKILFLKSDRLISACPKTCPHHMKLIHNAARHIASTNIAFYQKFEILSKRSTRDKIMTFLRLNAKRLGTTEFDIPYNRQELADFLCVDRTGLSAEISKLVREGVLETNKKHFKLL